MRWQTERCASVGLGWIRIGCIAFAAVCLPLVAVSAATDSGAGGVPCNSIALAGARDVAVSGTTVGGVDSAVSPCGAGGSDAPDASFEFVAPVAAIYVIDTVGSNFDTLLTVLDGTCEGPALACNDDGVGLQSRLTMSLSAGQRVTIVVDGFGFGAAGLFQLHIVATAADQCEQDADCNQPFETCQCCGSDLSRDAVLVLGPATLPGSAGVVVIDLGNMGASRQRCVSLPCFPGDCSATPTQSPTRASTATPTLPATRTPAVVASATTTGTAMRTVARSPTATVTRTPTAAPTVPTPFFSATATAPAAATPTPDRCGNGGLDAGEACDDGNRIGADGCAANCTGETRRSFLFGSRDSEGLIAFAPADSPDEPLHLTVPFNGSATVVIGAPGLRGDIPFVIPADSVRIDPLPIPALQLCGCLRIFGAAQVGLASQTLGAGNAAAGTIACGEGVEVSGYEIVLTASQPRAITRGSSGAIGSATVRVVAGLGLFNDGGSCAHDPGDPSKGPDGLPCTDDDEIGYAVDEIELTTGMASALAVDANGGALTLAVGPLTGTELDCGAILGGGSLEAGRLVFASSLRTTLLGDFVIGGRATLLCPGDCDGDQQVRVNDLVRAVNISLGSDDIGTCEAIDRDRNRAVTIEELTTAVSRLLDGCGSRPANLGVVPTASATGTATATILPTSPPSGPKPTPTPCVRVGIDQCCYDDDCQAAPNRPGSTCQCCVPGKRVCFPPGLTCIKDECD